MTDNYVNFGDCSAALFEAMVKNVMKRWGCDRKAAIELMGE